GPPPMWPRPSSGGLEGWSGAGSRHIATYYCRSANLAKAGRARSGFLPGTERLLDRRGRAKGQTDGGSGSFARFAAIRRASSRSNEDFNNQGKTGRTKPPARLRKLSDCQTVEIKLASTLN